MSVTAEDDFFLAIRQFQSADFDGSKNREVAILKSALFSWTTDAKLGSGSELPLLSVPNDCSSRNGNHKPLGDEIFCRGNMTVKRVRMDMTNQQHHAGALAGTESFPPANAEGSHALNQSLMVISDDDDESLTDTGFEKNSSSCKIQQMVPYAPMVESPPQQDFAEHSKLLVKGEHRLRIQFIELGTIGEVPQRFGKTRCGIPDGLCGTTHVYDQHWKFRVSHVVTPTGVRIKWRIENLASGMVSEVVESDNDSKIRCRSGRTICNIVLKRAFDMRAQELEEELGMVENDPSKYGRIQNLIHSLRPTRCTVGLLFFGLLHECVQQKWEAEMKSLEA